jgi:putative flippase GtrA
VIHIGGPSLSKLLLDIYTNQNERQRFLKFAIVGALGAAVDFGVLNLMHLGFGWTEDYANLLSVSCAILSNFTWNRLWSFPESRERPLHTQFGQFALVNLIGLGINQFVFLNSNAQIFTRFVGSPLNYNLAKATAIVVVLFWNFGANRIWTYRGI